MARSEVFFTTLPPALADRVEQARGSRRIGGKHGAQAPVAATLRALVALGLDSLDAAPAPVVAVDITPRSMAG